MKRGALACLVILVCLFSGCATKREVRDHSPADYPLIEVFHSGDFVGVYSIAGATERVVDFEAFRDVPLSYDRETEAFATEPVGIGRQVTARNFVIVDEGVRGELEVVERRVAGEHLYGFTGAVSVPFFDTFQYRSPVVLVEGVPFHIVNVEGTVQSGHALDIKSGWMFVLRLRPDAGEAAGGPPGRETGPRS